MSEVPEFAGKVVQVWCKPPTDGGVLEKVSVQRIDHRSFLVGQLADDGIGQDPRVGATFWFPLDDVLMLTIYPDLQTARAIYHARKSSTPEIEPTKPKKRFW